MFYVTKNHPRNSKLTQGSEVESEGGTVALRSKHSRRCITYFINTIE